MKNPQAMRATVCVHGMERGGVMKSAPTTAEDAETEIEVEILALLLLWQR